MAKTSTFCRCPEDLEGCRQSLIQAWGEGSIGEYCIMEGLRANLHQCRQVLLEGLYDKTSPRRDSSAEATAARGQKNGLHEACKAVVLLGYPLEIKVVPEVFHEAYYNLVRTIIHRFGIKDDSQPSADDVSQQVFTNLHEQFHKGASVQAPLAAYIIRVTVNACAKALQSEQKQHKLKSGYQPRKGNYSSAVFVPPKVVEHWEDFDHRLLNSNDGNLINRIILAQRCLEACVTGKRLSAKQLIADWQALLQMSERDTISLHEKTVVHVKHSPDRGVVHMAADLVNAGLAEPYQVAIVFAAAIGMDHEKTQNLLAQLSGLSATAIFARIHRIYKVLQPPGTEEQ